ncbi:MAG: hypothetical protein C0625_02925 [Arcobacter sp.]|nr:MAG: hypothetical protein C0625_02925 [Arcobacter sp.]
MKKIILVGLSMLILGFSAFATEEMKKPKMQYQAVPMEKVTLVQKGESKKYCPVCGMTLPMFYKTSHAAKHVGEDKQYCSIHCLVEDKEVNGSELTDIKVVDNKSLKLVDAKKAFYVVGSSKPGTMTMVSKYAFEKESDAKAFASENGGELKNFDEVYAMVSKGMEKEKAMIAKRQKKMQMMGEKVYNKMCKKTDKKFTSVADAKSFVAKNKLCGEMQGKKLQAVGIYLGRR